MMRSIDRCFRVPRLDQSRGGMTRWFGAIMLRKGSWFVGGVWTLSMGIVVTAFAEDLDLDSLPPPAVRTINYETDILPIFEQSCFRCHGAENPKSEFSLTHREVALGSGTYGENIVPGDSTNSPLIHFVARLVEDSEMPPVGKGEPLTEEQIGLLRAWIDQGVSYGEVTAPPQLEIQFAPAGGYYFVNGDDGKFREHHWLNDGWQAGLEHFRLSERLDDRTKLLVEGQALRDDYEVTLSLDRRGVGFIRAGFDQYRRFYDDSGGYHEPFTPAGFELDRDLSMEMGRAWVEAGWKQPGLPQAVLGYEYHYKEGEKSTTQWLPYTSPTSFATRNLYPAAKEVDEQRHVLRLDVSHEIAGLGLEDRFRYEFYELETSRAGAPINIFPISGLGDMVLTEDGQEHQRLVNTFFGQKQVRDWWLLSGGYLYTRMFDGEATFRQSTVDASGGSAFGNYWSGNEITLDHHAHVANLNSQFGPWKGVSLVAGVMPEWSRQEGFGDVNLDEGLPPLAGTDLRPAIIQSDYDRFSVREHATLRYTGIPFTSVFGEAQWQQESISQFESKIGAPGNFDTVVDYRRDTEMTALEQDYRAGFHVSPWSRASWSAHYRYREKDNDYDHDQDEQPLGFDGAGYSAFIRGWQADTDEVETKLTLKPLSWLKTSLSYAVEMTDYEVATDAAAPFAPGGRLGDAGRYDNQGFGINLVLTPWRRLYLSSSFNLWETHIEAEDNDVSSMDTYEGQTFSAFQSATVAINEKTDFTATYSFSHGNYDQDNQADGLAVGIKYYQHGLLVGVRRQLTQQISSRLQYGYFLYDEPSSRGFNDYEAHGILASVNVRFP